MSEYIATAQVQILPDLSKFTTNLTRDLNKQIGKFNTSAAKNLKPIQIPVAPKSITKAQLNAIRVAAQRSAGTLKPVQLSTTLGNVKGAGTVGNAANKANAAIGNVGASTKAANANLAQFNKTGGQTRATLLGLGTASARLDSALLGLRTAIGSTAVIGLGAGALAAIALGKAIRSLIQITVSYERELNVFQAVTSASADQMERVATAAKELGADITLPAVSAADAAVAMSELAKAGLSVEDAIAGARGVLQLATAANIGFAQATELAAAVLNAFQLSGKDAVAVADTLANAANAAQGSIVDMGIAFQQSSAVAELAGVNYQDTSVFLTQLAQAGLKGSDAGTSLRTALIRLINPTTKAAEIIKGLGVEIRDSAGNIRPDVFLQFSNAMRGMSKEQAQANLAIIGGQDALRAFAILGRASIKDFLALRVELRQQGTAAEVAAARTKGLGGAYQALQSTLETIGITIGQKVSPGLTDFVNNITATSNALAQSEGVAAAFSGAMAGVATALNLVGTAASIAGPLLLGLVNVTSKLTFGFGSSLIAALLATVVALKAYNVVAKSTTVTTIGLQVALAKMEFRTAAAAATAAGTSLTAFGKAAIVSRAALTALVSSFNLWVVAAVAAGAALFYLSTRETSAEKATRSLKESTDELVRSLEAVDTAARALDLSKLGVNQAKLGLLNSQKAAAQARAAFAASDAPTGSEERFELRLELAVALDDVTAATQRLRDAEKQLENDREAKQEANKQASDARKAEKQDILDLIAVKEREAKQKGPGGATGTRNGRNPQALRDLRIEAQLTGDITAEILRRAAESQKENTAFSRDIAKRLKLLDALRTNTNIPIRQLVRIILSEGDIASVVAKLGALSPEFGRALRSLPTDVQNIIRNALASALPTALAGGVELGKQTLAGFKAGFDSRLLVAEVRGASDAALLAIAQQGVDEAQRKFDRLDARFAKAGGPKNQAQQDKLDAAAQAVQDAEADRDAIQDRIDSDQKAAARAAEDRADSIADARNKADQAIIDAISGVRTTAQNKALQEVARRENAAQRALEAAADTDQLRDDIKAYNIAIAVTIQELKLVNKRIKDADTKIEANKKLSERLSELRRERKKTLAAITQNAIDRALQKTDLDIEFASIKDNVVAERRARLRKIKLLGDLLKAEAKAHGKNTVRYKELRNEIAREQDAINELNKQTKEKNKAAAALMFTFLQTQQGFAANLLGNLIPSSAAGGLVMGDDTKLLGPKTPLTDPGQQVAKASALTQAKAPMTPTSGQANTEIGILRQILLELKQLNHESAHPEAKYERKAGGSAMDVM